MDSQLPRLFRSFRDGMALARQRDLRLLSALGRLLKYVVWAGALTFATLNLWTAWPNYMTGLPRLGGPESPLTLVDIVLVLNGFSYSSAAWMKSGQMLNAYTAALRRAIAARDVTVAPAVDDAQAEADAGAQERDVPLEAETIAPLAHPLGSFGAAEVVYLLGVLAGLALLNGSIYFVVGAVLSGSLLMASEPVWWQSILFLVPALGAVAGTVISAWSLSVWRWARRERRGLVAQVDADGLSVRWAGRGARGQRLRWSDMRSFARLRYRDALLHTHIVYLLSTTDEDVLWDEPPVSRYSSPYEVAHAEVLRAAARRLAQVVEQRTKLPLLDISAVATAPLAGAYRAGQSSAGLFGQAIAIARGQGDVALATNLWQGTHPGAGEPLKHAVSRIRPSTLYLYTTPTQRDDIVRYALALLPYYPTAEQATPDPRERVAIQRKPRLEKRENAFVLIVLLGALVITGACLGLNRWYAPSLLQSLPAQARAQTPMYIAPFSAPQSDWPIRIRAGEDTRGARFTPRGYELTTRDPAQAVGAWSQFMSVDDSAIQVTMRLTSAGPDTDAASGGILLNVSADGSSAIAFTVNQYGDSHLLKCHDLGTSHGACDAEVMYADAMEINPDNDAANSLLVIRRGQMYMFYVNDAPIIVFRDTADALGARGYLGVYLDAGVATADFTNLTVYPASARLPFWVH